MATKTVHVSFPPPRPVRIAAVHAAAGFLASDPNLPMPTDIRMSAHDLTEAQFQELATAYGATIIEGTIARWITIPIMLESVHGVDVTYTAYGPSTR